MPWKEIRRSNVFGSDDVRLRAIWLSSLHENKGCQSIARMHIAGKLVERRLRRTGAERGKGVRGKSGSATVASTVTSPNHYEPTLAREAARGRQDYATGRY